MLWLLIFFSLVSWAQPSDASKPIFPDDTQDPKAVGGAEFLEAICPAHVVVGKQIVCDGPCSSYTGAPEGWVGQWTLTRQIRGNFMSATSDDVALAMSGCEPHSENFSGTVLLSRRSGRWEKL